MQLQPIQFRGRDRVEVKRKAFDYWYHHRARLGLSLCRFLSRCRLSNDERTMIFLG